MESSLINDDQVTASSEFDERHAAFHGRLNFKKGKGKAGGWSAATNDDSQWLQIAFPSYTKITGFATQGRNSPEYEQWVTKYELQYSDDGETFQYYPKVK